MNTFRFMNFPVYNTSKLYYRQILKISEEIKVFSLKDQIRRAALSVVLNIAEGSARKTDKDFARFLQISLGSINETVACLDIMYDNGYLNKEYYQILLNNAEKLARQLGGFVKKLYKDDKVNR